MISLRILLADPLSSALFPTDASFCRSSSLWPLVVCFFKPQPGAFVWEALRYMPMAY